MKNVFYVANNILTQEFIDDNFKDFKSCKKELTKNLKHGQYGTIFKCRYIDDDNYYYETLSIRFYKKVESRLIEIDEKEVKNL